MEEAVTPPADDDAMAVARALGAVPMPAEQPKASDDDAMAVARALGAVPLNADDAPAQQEAPPEHDSDYAGAAVRGLKNALAPHLLEKEDFAGDRNKGEVATEMGVTMATDIASNLATTAGAGAALGAVLGPAGAAAGAVVSAVGWAVYRGLGYEAARSSAQGEAFNPLRGILNVGAEVNPLTSKGGRLLKFATQAALESAKEYSYTGNAESAAVAGALGGAFAGAFHQNGPGWFASLAEVAARPTSTQVAPGLLKDDVSRVLRIFGDTSGTGLGARCERAAAKAVEDDPEYFKLGWKLHGEETMDAAGNAAGAAPHAEDVSEFKKWYMRQPGARTKDDDVEASFEHYATTLGDEKMGEAYKWFKLQKVALKEIGKYQEESLANLTMKPIKEVVGTGWADKLRDLLFVGRKIDAETGFNIEGSFNQFSEAKNRHSVITAGFLDTGNQLVTKLRKDPELGRLAKLENKSPQALVGEYLAGHRELTGNAKVLGDAWGDLFEQARVKLNQLGLKVDKLETESGRYLPQKAVTGADMHAALRREKAKLLAAHGQDLFDAPESEGVRRVVGHLLDMDPGDVTSVRYIDDAMEKALDPRAAKHMEGFEAFATFQRGDPIPKFVQEYDVGKLFGNYVNNNFKAALYHDAFMQMGAQVDMLKSAGMKNSAAYIERYMNDISGIPSNFIAQAQMKANTYKARALEMFDNAPKDSFMKKLYAQKKDLPDFLGFAVGQVYPNYLGWNLRAAVRNYFQPLLTTAPELGWGYGSKLVVKATMSAASDFFETKGINPLKKAGMFEEFLQPKGLAPGKHFGEAGDISGGGLRSKVGVGQGIELLDKANSAAMHLYGLSDNVNRYIVYKVGQELARDIERGHKAATDFAMRTLSEGGKAGARKLLADAASGKLPTEQLGEMLAKNLIAKTQFNYGKEAMNEWGREHGRLFSMFTKWPAMVMSDVAELRDGGSLFTKGTAQAAQRYLSPMALMFFAGTQMKDTTNGYVKWLVGDDLASAAPAQSFKVGLPPVIKTGMNAGDAFMHMFTQDTLENKANKFLKVGTDIGKAYLPGMAPLNEYNRMKKAGAFGLTPDEK